MSLPRTGHSSAASFPTGPVIADPFISPFGLTICIQIMVSQDLLRVRALSHCIPKTRSVFDPPPVP